MSASFRDEKREFRAGLSALYILKYHEHWDPSNITIRAQHMPRKI